MEDQDDCLPQDEQAIRDRIDDEIVNRDLLEREAHEVARDMQERIDREAPPLAPD
jgi:hypothetical protein